MYMQLCLAMALVSLLIVALPSFVPYQVPHGTNFVTLFIGLALTLLGWYALYVRAYKTGAIHIINPAKKNHTLWFYIFKDDEILITPAIRVAEGFTKSKELDAKIPDVKTYSLADHKVRIVPEVVGHSVDVDYVLYTNVLKTKYGVENLQQLRKLAFMSKNKNKENLESREHVEIRGQT